MNFTGTFWHQILVLRKKTLSSGFSIVTWIKYQPAELIGHREIPLN